MVIIIFFKMPKYFTESHTSPLDNIMPDFITDIENTRWPTDVRVLRALLELTRNDTMAEDENSVNVTAEDSLLVSEVRYYINIYLIYIIRETVVQW